ncbi:MAG TPA: BREX protein BrxB domain-containing protein [Phycisphaerae bacterium]|nr:BREX protein BrxB domain-containing protein [Phycisphaerae bacterium]
MGRIEELASRFRGHIGAPWQRNLAGDQKAIFVVYPKVDERRLRARLDLFEMASTSTGHQWKAIDLTQTFAWWMAETEYRDAYFEEPETLAMKLRSDFMQHAADQLRQALTADDVDENSVVAVQGVACLFGFTRVSLVLKEVVKDIRGRLVVFFPGEYEANNYRLLDARDGWNYLAVPITLHNGLND